MKIIIGLSIGIYVLLNLQDFSFSEVPVYYQSVDGCLNGDVKLDSITQFEAFTKNYKEYVMIKKYVSNPLSSSDGIVSIVNLNNDRIELVEYDVSIGCKETRLRITIDTLVSRIKSIRQFNQLTKGKFRSLKQFARKEMNKYHLAGILDGTSVYISYCHYGRCRSKIFHDPWTYYTQDSTIKELKEFKSFEKMLHESLGKHLWAL